jgi:hypothetical protein
VERRAQRPVADNHVVPSFSERVFVDRALEHTGELLDVQ